MIEYNLEPEYESCLDEIDKIKKKNENIEWEEIKKYKDSFEGLWEIFGFPKDYKEKWDQLVDYRKSIEERAEKSTGYLYDTGNVRQAIAVPTNSNSAWMVFKYMLMKKFPGIETIVNSESSAKRILECLKRESKDAESGKGLVMGYVQSGKTTNIESVITMGADYGYNIFIMLSGTIENLRKQNLNRLQGDIEFSQNSNIQWKFFDNIKGVKLDGYLQNEKARIVTVCLKNSTRLKNLNKWLIDSTSPATKAKMNIVIIDDEADQASLNTKKMKEEEIERTKINKLILELVNCKKFHSTNYISYTATPYGNFLNENSEESLYPKDFIISLPKSSQYIGAGEIFGNEDNIVDPLPILEEISENDYEKMENLSVNNLDFPESLKNSICWFICTLAVQRHKKSLKPVSMLIHTNTNTGVHKTTADAVEKWLNINKNNLLEECKKIYNLEKSKLSKEEFLRVMSNYNFDGLHPVNDYPEFDDIKNEIISILNAEISHITITEKGDLKFHKGIHIVIDNSNNKKGIDENGNFIRLAYPEKADIPVTRRINPNVKDKINYQNYSDLVVSKFNNTDTTIKVDLPLSLSEKKVMSETEIEKLLKVCESVSKILNIKNYDIEWTIDEKGNIYILQCRPITTKFEVGKMEQNENKKFGIGLVNGEVIGKVIRIIDENTAKKFEQGSILVTKRLSGYSLMAANKAIGCIIESKSPLSHSAIIARELGIPVVGNVDINSICNNERYYINGKTGEYKIVKNSNINKNETRLNNKEISLSQKLKNNLLKVIESFDQDIV